MIPKKDIRFLQRDAFSIYSSGKREEMVIKMIIEAGGNVEEAKELQEQFAKDYEFLIAERKRKEKRYTPIDLIIGSILLFGGILVSLGTYLFSDTIYVVMYGAILTGLIIFVRALIA
jgi:hypothetical protein